VSNTRTTPTAGSAVIGDVRHLFEIPDDIVYLNCANLAQAA
jgi:hypothetical protein